MEHGLCGIICQCSAVLTISELKTLNGTPRITLLALWKSAHYLTLDMLPPNNPPRTFDHRNAGMCEILFLLIRSLVLCTTSLLLNQFRSSNPY